MTLSLPATPFAFTVILAVAGSESATTNVPSTYIGEAANSALVRNDKIASTPTGILMNNKVLKTLDFYKIINMLLERSQSIIGKKTCRRKAIWN